MRTWIQRQVYKRVTSPARRDGASARAEAKRQATGAARQLDYFHRFGDPASALMVQLLSELEKRYDIDVRVHLTGAPDPAVTPAPRELEAFTRIDAERLAKRYGLAFTDPGAQPDLARIAAAEAALATVVDTTHMFEVARDVDAALWSGGALPKAGPGTAPETLKRQGDELRDKRGHFQSGAISYAGQWYWGADRLHYLQARLDAQGARRDGAPADMLAPPLLETTATGDVGGAVLDIYPSLRSPYTYLAMARAFALADRWNATPEIRFVLPMVMRSLPVPRRKGLYFLKDAKREAERLGLPFGNICDPLGRPTERGLAVLHHAMRAGNGKAFLLSFLKGVWADGIDAGSDPGLRAIAERAGVSWDAAQDALGDDSWREVAEANRARLAALGLWGVPSFRFGDVAVWGQDRLWVIEEALAKAAK